MSDTAPPSGLLSVEAARDAVLAAARATGTERVQIGEAYGRVAAEVTAGPDVVAALAELRDGRVRDPCRGHGRGRWRPPRRLEVIGEVRAGFAPDVTVRAGTAVRIATGARLPDGADAVVPVEATTPLDGAGRPGPRGRDATGPLPAAVDVHEVIRPGGSIRAAGSDLREGATLVEPGDAIGAAAIALLAGAGVAAIVVHRRPRVAVLATGDEVRAPGEPLGPAGIPDANGPGLRALAAAAGADVIDLGIATDVLEDVLGRLRRGLADGADAIIVAGGVSVGPFDVVKAAIESVGTIDLWRVAVQPGKPFAFGTAERPSGGPPVLIVGLPGNPVSGAVTFELFVRPAIRRMAGRRDVLRPVDRAVLGDDVTKSEGRRAFVRVVAQRDEDGAPSRDEQGRVRVRLAGGAAGQGSHVISALAIADGLAVIPETVPGLPAGAEVDLWWLDRP